MSDPVDPGSARVVLYGTGKHAVHIVRCLLEKGHTIVAAVNRSGEGERNKVGRDLGELTGADDARGIIVQDSEGLAYDSLEADVAIVALTDRLETNITAYERVLNAGINVLSSASESSYPRYADPVLGERIDQVARRNGVSFLGTSVWDMTRIWSGILVTGCTTEIDALHHTSITNIYAGGLDYIRYAGIGLTQEEFKQRMQGTLSPLGGIYVLPVRQVLEFVGFTVTGVSEYNEPVLFEEAIDCPKLERVLAPGTVVGTRIVAELATAQGVMTRVSSELRMFRPGEREHTSWRVEGRPPCTVTVDRRDTFHATAAALVNRIPDVIAAPPGVQVASDMGPMRSTALSGSAVSDGP